MFHKHTRARLPTVTMAVALALGSKSAAVSASADDAEAIDVGVSVIEGLPTGPVDVGVTLPVGAHEDSAPVIIRVHGLEPFSYVEVWVHSTPFLFDSGIADAEGCFEASGTLPANLEIGGHTITVEGTSADGSAFIQVVASFAIIEGGTIDSATTSDSNGALGLVVSGAAVATFGGPTLVKGRSTTSGSLGRVVISDGRTQTREGRTLSASVAGFVNAANGSVIGSSQLGIVPQLVSTDAQGIGLFPGQAAGSASYPMNLASGSPAQAMGFTVLDAGLTFVAPPEKTVGTYESTLSLTLVSQ